MVLAPLSMVHLRASATAAGQVRLLVPPPMVVRALLRATGASATAGVALVSALVELVRAVVSR